MRRRAAIEAQAQELGFGPEVVFRGRVLGEWFSAPTRDFTM